MFAITPRLTNDFGPFNLMLMDELADPFQMYNQRSQAPVLYRDGTLGHIGGRLGDSQIQNTDKEFRIRLDLNQYKPEEVKITSDNHTITVHAKHEERQDNHGYISREMKRVYKLPNDVDPNSATSTMNTNGTLSIKVAKNAVEAPKETAIPVEFQKE